MSEVAAIVNSPGRAGVSREMRDAGAVGMSRAQGFLSSSPREEHLRVGPHQGDGDFAPPIELATDDGPGRLAVIRRLLNLCGPECIDAGSDGRPPRSEDGEGRGKELRPLSLNMARVLGNLRVVAMLGQVRRTRPRLEHPLREPTG
jgi:hypothetical protein